MTFKKAHTITLLAFTLLLSTYAQAQKASDRINAFSEKFFMAHEAEYGAWGDEISALIGINNCIKESPKTYANTTCGNTEKTIEEVMTRMESEEFTKLSNSTQAGLATFIEVLNVTIGDKRNQIEEGDKPIKTLSETEHYIKHNVKIYEFKTDIYTARDNKILWGITFKLKNTGNKTLKKVEITIYFYNKDKVAIYEKKYYPTSDAPLKPNYIFQMPKNKFIGTTDVPSEWVNGSISQEITVIEFDKAEKEGVK